MPLLNWLPEKEKLQICGIYLTLALLSTYPLALNFTSSVPGGGDAYSHMWNMWWYKHAIFDLHTNPFQTDYVTYPHTLNLGSVNDGLLPIAMSIPLQFLFSLTATYNILLILTFVLSGLGAYLLVEYMTKNKNAALIGGMVFAFSPYHLAKGLGALFLANVQWLPFYALFLLKTFDEKSDWKAPVLAGIFFAAASLSDWTYMMYLLMFTAAYALYALVVRRKPFNKALAKKATILAVVSALLVIPALYPIISSAVRQETSTAPLSDTIELSADMLGFFAPGILHTIARNAPWTPGDFYSKRQYTSGERTVYLGYTALALGIFGMIARSKKAFFWFAAGLVTFVLMLGPVLHIGGNDSWQFGNTTVHVEPLPYLVLGNLPFFSYLHVPARLDAILTLCLAVLAGFGAAALFERLEKRKNNGARTAAIVAIFVLIFIEYAAVPYPLSSTEIPAYYLELKTSNGNEVLLEYPAITAETQEYDYFQTVHGKKIVWGHFQHNLNSPQLLASMDESPVLSRFTRSGQNGILQLSTADDALTAKSILSYYNITRLVFHKKRFYSDENQPYYSRTGLVRIGTYAQALKFAETLSRKKAFEDGEVIVFETDRQNAPFLLPAFKDNWDYSYEGYSYNDSTFPRYIPIKNNSKPAIIEILSNFGKPVQANLSAAFRRDCSENCTAGAEFEINGNKLGRFETEASGTFGNITINNLRIEPGKNELVISGHADQLEFREIKLTYR